MKDSHGWCINEDPINVERMCCLTLHSIPKFLAITACSMIMNIVEVSMEYITDVRQFCGGNIKRINKISFIYILR